MSTGLKKVSDHCVNFDCSIIFVFSSFEVTIHGTRKVYVVITYLLEIAISIAIIISLSSLDSTLTFAII